MEADFSVEFDNEIDSEEINNTLSAIESNYEDLKISKETEEGAFGVSTGTLTLIIAVNASIQTLACTFPKIKSAISSLGGSVGVDNTIDIAKERLEEHTAVKTEDLELSDKSYERDYAVFVFNHSEDDTQHRIKVNEDDLRDWVYELER